MAMKGSCSNGTDSGGSIEVSSGSKPVVCFLGPISSYTHQATLDTFPEDKFELRPVTTIKDIFDTTQAGGATYGVVPFENSTNGSVVFTLDNFADRHSQYLDLAVCAEIYLDVHHCLLGHFRSPSPPPTSTATRPISIHATQNQNHHDHLLDSPPVSGQCTPTPSQPQPSLPRSKPLADLRHVQRIYSHPQAFGQCTRFLQTYLRGVETIDVSSTSPAAELVKSDSSGTSAAISSAIAAELRDLDVLGRNIEDREDNTTRFFVLRRGVGEEGNRVEGLTGRVPRALSSHSAGTLSMQDKAVAEGRLVARMKSLVSFTVPHTAPGALAAVLECFRSAGLNLTSINSRPSLNEPFQYVFFVEFEGHRYDDPEGRVKDVLEGVGKVAQTWRWLGSWENMRC